ncbi:DUF2381 family protein [Archangium violaceum]|uniref:DUF2381 family protein n=1 Tax=Archangium violaceum TaxID=83451 RepID=UPI001EF68837|nr:DUF2381 family protein [Archangium violaceum]
MPPLELHLAPGVATVVEFEAPLLAGFEPPVCDGGFVQISRLNEGAWVFVATPALPADAPVLLTVNAEDGAEPLRFSLVTRGDAVDLWVRVVRAPASTDEDGAELMARRLLDAPDARATLAVPQEVAELNAHDSRGQVESVLWLGRRFFATVAVRSRKKGAPPWRLVQGRLRVMLADGVLLEWPAHVLSGGANAIGQRHVLTGLLPEGASRLELALDGQDSPGTFQPLRLEEALSRP